MPSLRATELIGPEFLLIAASGATLMVGTGSGPTAVTLAVCIGLVATVGLGLGSTTFLSTARQRLADYLKRRRETRAA